MVASIAMLVKAIVLNNVVAQSDPSNEADADPIRHSDAKGKIYAL